MITHKIGLDHIASKIKNTRVLMRVDYNVPLENGQIMDLNRIKQTLPSIKKILSENPKSLVLMSHMGRPNGKRVEKLSLKPVAPALEKLLGQKVTFLPDCSGPEVEQAVLSSNNGEIFLLENLRYNSAEIGKIKDDKGNYTKVGKEDINKFRKSLSKMGELYVNDAFGTAHRSHSSMVGIDVKIRAAGYLLKKELDYFGKALEDPESPFLVIVGGSKVSSKINLINNLLDKVDEMIIGGGMAFTFMKKIYNMKIGQSLFDEKGYLAVDEIMEKAKKKKVQIHLPLDWVCADRIDRFAKTTRFEQDTGIPDEWMGLDAGPKTRRRNSAVVERAKLVVWNGPLGLFEIEKFRGGSLAMLNDINARTKSGQATTIVGGGDTASLVNMTPGAGQYVSHISTGGGASLELLEGKILPGVAFLTNIEDIEH